MIDCVEAERTDGLEACWTDDLYSGVTTRLASDYQSDVHQ